MIDGSKKFATHLHGVSRKKRDAVYFFIENTKMFYIVFNLLTNFP